MPDPRDDQGVDNTEGLDEIEEHAHVLAFSRAFDGAFGARLRAAREARGRSQSELAANLVLMYGIELHQTQLSKIELGVRPARLNEAVAVAELLEMNLNELVYGEVGGERATNPQVARAIGELAAVRRYVGDRIHSLQSELGPGPGAG